AAFPSRPVGLGEPTYVISSEGCKNTKKTRRAGLGTRHAAQCLLCVLCAFVGSSATGCQQKMAGQPSYRPLRPSDYFDDGRSARPLVEGTVPYNAEHTDARIATGRVPNPDAATGVLGEFVNAFPFEITKDDLERGRERYTIFCAVCHDPVGTGQGKIVERGYTMPP